LLNLYAGQGSIFTYFFKARKKNSLHVTPPRASPGLKYLPFGEKPQLSGINCKALKWGSKNGWVNHLKRNVTKSAPLTVQPNYISKEIQK
jgi:hypothetical protein